MSGRGAVASGQVLGGLVLAGVLGAGWVLLDLVGVAVAPVWVLPAGLGWGAAVWWALDVHEAACRTGRARGGVVVAVLAVTLAAAVGTVAVVLATAAAAALAWGWSW